MPCRSDYMEPTERDKESVRVMEFLREIDGLTFDHDNPWTKGQFAHRLNKDTERLCAFCRQKELYPSQMPKFSLELQLWWKRHKKADATRTASALEHTLAAKVATGIHEVLCYANHTDGCGWYYEKWETMQKGGTRDGYLMSANKFVAECAKFGVDPNVGVRLMYVAAGLPFNLNKKEA